MPRSPRVVDAEAERKRARANYQDTLEMHWASVENAERDLEHRTGSRDYWIGRAVIDKVMSEAEVARIVKLTDEDVMYIVRSEKARAKHRD